MTEALRLHSGTRSTIDAIRSSSASATTQLLAVTGFALLTALGAQFRIYLWEVPFSLQTLAVYGSGLFLGWRNGMLAQGLYIALGMFLPVFAGDGFGPAYLMTAVSAGYLLAYPLSAAAAGALSTRWNSPTGSMLSLLVASIILFTIGVTWLHFAAGHATWMESLDKGWLRFIPVDVAKILCVGLLYSGARHLGRQRS
ncbi:MAG: biotin biosynthesis protein BioY [Bacteroidetes bacterium CG12_big_fil_rev_8_21_14_0_65_60_17]|nr:MAG: biotin biosynthesis protein BioY [Bacteroidetes bacterium CG12_big_fil_rev_8_21_14_0_65_60_17]